MTDNTLMTNKGTKMKIKFTPENILAIIGIILIQGALLPSHISGHFPDISLPIFIFAGLLCYLYKAINSFEGEQYHQSLVRLGRAPARSNQPFFTTARGS